MPDMHCDDDVLSKLSNGRWDRLIVFGEFCRQLVNDWKTMSENTNTVEYRGHLLLFEPKADEIHRQTAHWRWDQEIFDWFGNGRRQWDVPSAENQTAPVAAELVSLISKRTPIATYKWFAFSAV